MCAVCKLRGKRGERQRISASEREGEGGSRSARFLFTRAPSVLGGYIESAYTQRYIAKERCFMAQFDRKLFCGGLAQGSFFLGLVIGEGLIGTRVGVMREKGQTFN